MKFVPRMPREGINVSDEHPLVEAATLIAGLLAILVGIALAVVFFVDLVLLFLSPRVEAWLFQKMMVQQIVAAEYDSEQVRSLQVRVDRLADTWQENPYEFRAGILIADEPNALALPGGVILVTTALLEQTESENELAFIIGHEIGHFRNRDHLRQLGRAALLSLMVAAVLGQNSESLGGNVIGLTMSSFSRGQESEADQFGLKLVYEAYGHVGQAWRFFERIAEGEGELGSFATFAASHPAPEDRIDQLLRLAKRNDWPVDGLITPLDPTL
jgi:Zn-dependent protease with chaperone function